MALRAIHHTAALVATLFVAVAASAQAQDTRGRIGVSLQGGGTDYDLAWVGTATVAALRVEIPAFRRIIVEPGLGYFNAKPEFEPEVTMLYPEVSVQFDPMRGRVRPYLGVGGGWTAVVSGGSGSEGTVHGALGLRVRVLSFLDLKSELRVRSVDPFTGSTADYTGGFTIRL